MPSVGILLVLFATLFTLVQTSQAQERPGSEGVLHLTNWPTSSLERTGLSERRINQTLGRFDLLPYIDTLTVGYRYETAGDEPVLSLAIEWKPGQYGILDGRRVAFERMPDSLLLTALTLEASVYADGKHITETVIRIDSMALAPSPDVTRFTLTDLRWDDLFVHTPHQAARRIFDEGFELRTLNIVSASFESYDADRDRSVAGTYRSERRTPSRRTAYDDHTVTGILIDLGWLFPPRVWHPDRNEDREQRPRGNSMGRGSDSDEDDARGSARRGGSDETVGGRGSEESGDASGRSSRSRDSGSSKKGADDRSDDSDDEDRQKLLPAALTAAAAVGILAYKGGTVGYFGNAKFAPYGLSAGMVRPKGGFLLQAGVNDAVFGSSDGPEHLVGKILIFRQILPVPIQPAMGAGVLVTHDDTYTYEPSLSVGAIGTFGPIILQSVYDVVQGGMEFGIAFNFRSRPR